MSKQLCNFIAGSLSGFMTILLEKLEKEEKQDRQWQSVIWFMQTQL